MEFSIGLSLVLGIQSSENWNQSKFTMPRIEVHLCPIIISKGAYKNKMLKYIYIYIYLFIEVNYLTCLDQLNPVQGHTKTFGGICEVACQPKLRISRHL